MCEDESLSKFAKRLGVSSQYLCDLEHGRKTVSPKKAKEFAEKLGYLPEQFVELAEQDILDHDGMLTPAISVVNAGDLIRDFFR